MSCPRFADRRLRLKRTLRSLYTCNVRTAADHAAKALPD